MNESCLDEWGVIEKDILTKALVQSYDFFAEDLTRYVSTVVLWTTPQENLRKNAILRRKPDI